MHIPVLLHEVIDGLRLRPNDTVIDATLGYGGHAEAVLQQTSPHGKLIAFERDEQTLRTTQQRLTGYKDRCVCIHGSYAELNDYREQIRVCSPVRGIMADLGLSSLQLDDEARGFAFRFENAPLDMRFDTRQHVTAASLLASADEQELHHIFTQYGDIPFARTLARAILRKRQSAPLLLVADLTMLVESCVGKWRAQGKLAQVFQALRIAVNQEFHQLNLFLPAALDLLESGGRLAIISFHSGEDRIVKRWIVEEARDCVCPPEFPECRCTHRARIRKITKKPIEPSEEEIHTNPRARSAKLRIIEKI